MLPFPVRALAPPPPPPKAAASKASAFAVLASEQGPILASPEVVPDILNADWGLFLELATYLRQGFSMGSASIAYGVEEVAEAVVQAAVAVLFVPVECGHGGEGAVRSVAGLGGRGYIVGLSHELHDDIAAWGAAAILYHPLEELRAALETPAEEPSLKRQKPGDDGAPEAAVPERPVNPERELRRAVKTLGSLESLQDKTAIPRMAESLREPYLEMLGAPTIFSILADAFLAAKGVAHRKAMVYTVHELLTRKRAVMSAEDRRPSCLQHFLMRIGSLIRGFQSDERVPYCKLVVVWQKAKVFSPIEFGQLKDAWDMD